MPGFWMKTEQGNDVHINGDPGMSEEMRGEVLGDPCPLGNPADLSGDSVPFQLLAGFGEEYRRLFSKRKRVVGPPFGEVLLCHDQPDVSGDPGLEIDIHRDPFRIGFHISPGKLTDLTRAEPSFIQGHQHCPVPGASASLDKDLDLFRSEELGSRFGFGVFSWSLDAFDLLFRKIRIFILNHPEKELLEDGNIVKEGILLEGTVTAVFGMFDGFYTIVDSRQGESIK